MANWSQFQRVRYQIGPSPEAIRDIHEAVTKEYAASMDITALPFTVCVAGTTVLFENLWVGTPK
jgi:hypothetical protein